MAEAGPITAGACFIGHLPRAGSLIGLSAVPFGEPGPETLRRSTSLVGLLRNCGAAVLPGATACSERSHPWDSSGRTGGESRPASLLAGSDRGECAGVPGP